MAEKPQEPNEQWTNIDDLVAETEKIEFIIAGSSPEENINDVLKEVEEFRRESKRKLSVIEEERRKSNSVDGSESLEGDEDDDAEDGKDAGENTESAKTDSEKNGHTPPGEKKNDTNDIDEQKKALKTLREIKRALKDLKSFNIEDTAAKERGECRIRSSSSSNRLQRPKSSYPILESTRLIDNGFTRTNNNKAKKPMFDINTLNRELVNLLSMSDAPIDLSLLEEQEEIFSPLPVPATPPCTPAYTFQVHPLSPTELNNRRGVNQLQSMTDAKPPPKPPRLNMTPAKKAEILEKSQETAAENSSDQEQADQVTDDQMNDGRATADHSAECGVGQVQPAAGTPPPKPPRVISANTMNRLKIQTGKFSISMGNLTFSGEPKAKSPLVIDPSSSQNTEVESPDVGKTLGEKMEQMFSKEKLEEIFSKENVEKIFSRLKKRSKKGKGIPIGKPTDFRHVTESAPKEELTDEEAPLVTHEADTPTSDKNVPFISDSQAPSTTKEQEPSEDSDTNTISDENLATKADENLATKADEQTTLNADETQTTTDEHSAATSNLSNGQVNTGFDQQEGMAPETKTAPHDDAAKGNPEEISPSVSEGIVNSGFDKQEENVSNTVSDTDIAATTNK